MKDLGKDNQVHLDKAIRINHTQLNSKPKPTHFLQKGDLIFCSRGQTNTAALLNKEATDTICSSPLFRIRVNQAKIIPAYLLWWINQPASQHYLRTRSVGTMLKMINKEILANLVVTLPPLEQQARIAEFSQLAMKEKQLLSKLKQYKYSYAQGILMQMAEEVST